MRDIKKYSAWDLLELLSKEKPGMLKYFEADDKRKQKRQFWMRRFEDQVIRNSKMFWTKLKYSQQSR